MRPRTDRSRTEDREVTKRIVGDLLKYAVALGLLAWVLWSNWGDPRGTVGRVTVGGEPARGQVAGTVVDYSPGDSITVERLDTGESTHFALKKPGAVAAWLDRTFGLSLGKLAIVDADGTPRPDGEALPRGTAVTLGEVSRGLAYVWQQKVRRGEPVHLDYLLAGFALVVGGTLLTFVRWYVLVRAVGLPFRLFDAFRLGFIGLFFNTFMPGSVGGDVIKAAALAREHSRRTVAVATVIMDRVIALWALIWFVALLGAAFWLGGLLTGPGAEQCRTVVRVAWAVVGASALVWLLLGLLPDWRAERFARRLEGLRRVGGPLAELWRAGWIYRRRPRAVAGVLALSWVGHVGFVLLFWCAVHVLWRPESGEEIPTLAQHFLIVPIGLVIQAMPFFPGGAGIGELGFGLLYQWLGCSEASGVLGSLVQRVLNWALGLLGYVVYLRMRSALAEETNTQREQEEIRPVYVSRET